MWFRVLVSGLLLLWLTATLAGATSRALAQAAPPKPSGYTGVTDAYKKVTDTAQAAKEAQAAYREAWDAADAANWNDPALNAAKSAAYNKWAEALDAADIAADRFDAAQAAYDKYSKAFKTWDEALDARDANPGNRALEENAEAAYDDFVKARKTAELLFAAVLDMTPPGVIIQSGSAEFCSYNPSQPPEMTPVDDPRDAPPDGDDPRDAPPPDGDDPRDQATDDAMAAVAKAQAAYEAAAEAFDEAAYGLFSLDPFNPDNAAAIDDAENKRQIADAAQEAYEAALAAKEALDDPRDAPPPDGDDPRDRALEDAMAAVAETQAAFDDAAAHAREVRNSGGDVTPSDLAAWEAFKALKAAKAAKAALEDPGDQADGDDPRDAPTPDGDDPRDVAIKATTAAQTSTGKALARTQVKALAPDQTNVALPAAGADKPQTGAGADPMHCTTGNDGSCTLHGNRKELGLPANTPDSVNVAVADPAVKSFNLQVQPGTQPIGALTDFVTDSQQIGDQSFITVTAPVEQADLLQALIGQQPDLIAVEENICGDKEPAGIMPGCPVSAFDRGQG